MTVKVLHPRNSDDHLAEWLEGLATKLRMRGGGGSAKAMLVIDLGNGRASCAVEFHCSPGIVSPLDAVGLLELGKLTYLSSE